jgi:hypothetical protein
MGFSLPRTGVGQTYHKCGCDGLSNSIWRYFDTVKQPESISDLENFLVSIFEDEDSGRAEETLKDRGFGVLKLSGSDVVDPLVGLHQMAADGGLRILDDVYQELQEGNLALIVEVAPEQSGEISELLYKIGARSVWEFEDWALVKRGPDITRRPR